MDSIWWNRVPNARSLVDVVVNKLLNDTTVLLQYNNPIPWKDSFVNRIKDGVREKSASKSFATIAGVTDPGKYLLNEYCKAAKRATYRPSKGFAPFFAESDDIVLHEYYFWVEIETNESLDAWHKFVSDYANARGKGKSVAVFVLDCHGLQVKHKRKGIENVDVDRLINEYDKRIFSTLISGVINEKSYLKAYLTELLINIVGPDIELLSAVMSNYNAFLNDPKEALLEISANNTRSDGTQYSVDKELPEVEHGTWKAQIKTIYPLVEEYRQAFVNRHSKAIITNCLPVENSAGEIIRDPQELELGTLVYLADIKKLVLQGDEYDRLVCFKDARNILSHLGVLTLTEVEQLFRMY